MPYATGIERPTCMRIWNASLTDDRQLRLFLGISAMQLLPLSAATQKELTLRAERLAPPIAYSDRVCWFGLKPSPIERIHTLELHSDGLSRGRPNFTRPCAAALTSQLCVTWRVAVHRLRYSRPI